MVIHTDYLLTVLLLALRVFAFVTMVPFFGTFSIPGFVRAYLSLGIALSIMSFAEIQPVEIRSVSAFIGIAFVELLFGFMAGLFLRFLFEAVFVAGEIIAVSTGLGLLTMFLPQQPQSTVLAGFSTMMASVLFLSLGGAEAVYTGLVSSVRDVPIGSFSVYSLRGDVFLELFYGSFSMGVVLALPVLIATLLTNVIMAIVNRFIPQMNVFMVGLPLQLAVGLIVLTLSLPVLSITLVSYIREYVLSFVKFVSSG